MGIHNNFPAISWIKLDGISVTHGEHVYIVKDFKTNLKYIYWSEDTPEQLTSSNVMLDKTSSRFLIGVNNKGEYMEAPNEDIVVSFDGNSVDAINEHIWGLYEKDEQYGNRFVSVEQNIEGITNTVGQHREDIDSVSEYVSKVDQKADEINLSVKEVKKEYDNDKETIKLREDLNSSIIKINSHLGIFKSEISGYFKDNSISNDENTKIKTQLNLLASKKLELNGYIDKVILIAQQNGYSQESISLDSAKKSLENIHNSLVSAIENAILDKVITPSEITVVIDGFGKYSSKVNDIKNICDSIILLGVGGLISEELSRIDVTSDEIKLSVSNVETNLKENVKNVDNKYSEILLSSNGIVSRVGSVESKASSNSSRLNSAESSITQLSNSITSKVTANDVKSIIEQSPDEIRFGFNDISNYVSISTSGLTVSRGSIYCDSIKASSSSPIIKLFEGNGLNCAIDATAHMNQGVGNSIRLKRDDSNYVYVGNGNIALYCTGSNNNESALCTFSGNTSTFNMSTKGGNLVLNSGVSYNGNKLAYTSQLTWGSISGKPSFGTGSGQFAHGNHTHSGYATTSSLNSYLPKESTSICLTGSHSPYYTNTYNCGWSSQKWQQVSAQNGYFDNSYLFAVDNPVATVSTLNLDNVIDDIIIEDSTTIQRSGFDDKLVINVNALKENDNGHLFISEDDGGNVVVNEGNLLVLALKEIKDLKTEVKKIDTLENEINNLNNKIDFLTNKLSELVDNQKGGE